MSFIPDKELSESAAVAIAAEELGTVEDVLGRNLRAHRPLKRLSPQHRKVLGLHLQGLSTKVVAELCGLSQRAVGLVLGDEIVRQYIAEFEEQADRDLRALVPASIEALRTVIQNGEHKQQLSAADKVLRATGLYDRHKGADGGGDTAEDVIARILDTINGVVNLSRDLKPKGDIAKVIDAPYAVIEGGKSEE